MEYSALVTEYNRWKKSQQLLSLMTRNLSQKGIYEAKNILER